MRAIPAVPRMMLRGWRRKWLLLSAGIVVSLALLAVLLTQIGIASSGNAWRGYRPEFFLAALFMYVCCQVFRALRFRPLIGAQKARMYDLLPLLCVQGLIHKFFPFLGGEISFVYLLRRQMGVEYPKGAIVLFLSRGVDLLITGMVLLGMAFSPWWRASPSVQLAGILSGAIGVILIGLPLAAIIQAEKLSRLPEGRSEGPLPGFFLRIFIRVFAGGDDARASWRSGGSLGPLGRCAFWSIPMWVAQFLTFYFLFLSASGHVTWELILWGFFATWVLSMLPIRGFADIGVWEGSWTAIFVAAGMSAPEALRIAFVGHAGLIVVTTLAGVTPLLFSLARKYGHFFCSGQMKNQRTLEKT